MYLAVYPFGLSVRLRVCRRVCHMNSSFCPLIRRPCFLIRSLVFLSVCPCLFLSFSTTQMYPSTYLSACLLVRICLWPLSFRALSLSARRCLPQINAWSATRLTRLGEGLKALIDLPANQAEMDKYALMHTVPATPQVRGIPPDVIAGKIIITEDSRVSIG